MNPVSKLDMGDSCSHLQTRDVKPLFPNPSVNHQAPFSSLDPFSSFERPTKILKSSQWENLNLFGKANGSSVAQVLPIQRPRHQQQQQQQPHFFPQQPQQLHQQLHQHQQLLSQQFHMRDLHAYGGSLGKFRDHVHESPAPRICSTQPELAAGPSGSAGPESGMTNEGTSLEALSSVGGRDMPLSPTESIRGVHKPEIFNPEIQATRPSPPEVKAPALPLKGHTQDHIMAERKRREKLSQRFIALSAIVPGLKKVFPPRLLVHEPCCVTIICDVVSLGLVTCRWTRPPSWVMPSST